MDAIGTVRTIVVTVAALAVSTAGVAASESEMAAPVQVFGTELEGPCPEGTSRTLSHIEQNRGVTCEHTWSTSDSRLDGTYTRILDLDLHKDATELIIAYASGRVENEGGTWHQRPSLQVGFAGQARNGPPAETLVFEGGGAYEGLVAVVQRLGGPGTSDEPRRLRGWIIEGDVPTQPEGPRAE